MDIPQNETWTRWVRSVWKNEESTSASPRAISLVSLSAELPSSAPGKVTTPGIVPPGVAHSFDATGVA